VRLRFDENRPSVRAIAKDRRSAHAAPQKIGSSAPENSSGLAIVMLQQPAELLVVSDITASERDRGRHLGIGLRQGAIIPSLVGSMPVVEFETLRHDVPQMFLAEADEMIRTFLLDRLHEPLGEGVQVRLPRPDPHHFRSVGFQRRSELGRELEIHVHDQMSRSRNFVLGDDRKVAGLLHHPRFVGVRGHAGHMNPLRAYMNEKEHKDIDQSALRPDFLGEEVAGPECFGMPLDELVPRPFPALRAGIESLLFEDGDHRRTGNPNAQFLQLAEDPGVGHPESGRVAKCGSQT